MASIALAAALFIYTEIRRPFTHFRELEAREAEGEAVDPAALRDAAHKCLRWIPDHDAIVTLMKYGDESSIPILIKSLDRLNEPNDDGPKLCTSAHCLEALQRITGVDYGFDTKAWNASRRKRKEASGAVNP